MAVTTLLLVYAYGGSGGLGASATSPHATANTSTSSTTVPSATLAAAAVAVALAASHAAASGTAAAGPSAALAAAAVAVHLGSFLQGGALHRQHLRDVLLRPGLRGRGAGMQRGRQDTLPLLRVWRLRGDQVRALLGSVLPLPD